MILSVSVITKAGNTLVARQFSNFTRSQVEGQLVAFPKLVSQKSQSYIETETIRYVFQDLGELYFIVITSRESNILEDLDLLSLLLDLTRQIAGEMTEESVLDNSLTLITAYDECIFDGYRQNVTAAEVATFLRMESKEEDEAVRIRKEKEEKAAEELREKLRELEKTRKAMPAKSAVQEIQHEPIIEEAPAPAPRARRPAGKGGMVLGSKASARDRARRVIMEEDE